MLQWYSVRLRIYSWFMKYLPLQLASVGVIAVFPVVTLVGANTHACLDLSTPDHVLLQHFWLGLSKESALHLDITAGASFAHKTAAKGESPLDRILEFLFAQKPQRKKKFNLQSSLSILRRTYFNILEIPRYTPSKRRRPALVDPADRLDKASLKETIQGSTSIMSCEWLLEGELSSEAIQIRFPSAFLDHSMLHQRN